MTKFLLFQLVVLGILTLFSSSYVLAQEKTPQLDCDWEIDGNRMTLSALPSTQLDWDQLLLGDCTLDLSGVIIGEGGSISLHTDLVGPQERVDSPNFTIEADGERVPCTKQDCEVAVPGNKVLRFLLEGRMPRNIKEKLVYGGLRQEIPERATYEVISVKVPKWEPLKEVAESIHPSDRLLSKLLVDLNSAITDAELSSKQRTAMSAMLEDAKTLRESGSFEEALVLLSNTETMLQLSQEGQGSISRLSIGLAITVAVLVVLLLLTFIFRRKASGGGEDGW